jgi:LMBR1 domain-containing protein 1
MRHFGNIPFRFGFILVGLLAADQSIDNSYSPARNSTHATGEREDGPDREIAISDQSNIHTSPPPVLQKQKSGPAMVDIFLIVSSLVGFGILVIGGFYLLVHYQHPDDHNVAYMPKFVVLGGFVLAGITVLLLPLDVANREGYAGCAGYDTQFCGGLPLALLWNVVFFAIPLWMFILIPFATFYYEADDGMLMAGTAYSPNPVKKSRLRQAIVYEIFVLLIMGIIFTFLYFLLGETKIPVQEYTGFLEGAGLGIITNSSGSVITIAAQTPQGNATEPIFSTSLLRGMTDLDQTGRGIDGIWLATVVEKESVDIITLAVDMSTFFGGFMAWLGWWAFAMFGGIGLAALPLDLILAYTHRPRRLDAVEFAEIQMSLRERTNELVDIGELLKIEREQKAQAGMISSFGGWSLDSEARKNAREERQAILGFKQAVFLLEEDVDQFQAAADLQKFNPLIPYGYLLLGICAVIISVFWFLHIILYVFPETPFSPFLNNYFAWFDGFFPLFGVLSIAVFTFYLLMAAVKGAFKFGLRFLFFHIHPMKPGKTYMSSFMFNIALVLMCALPVVQFCQEAFADYTSFADIRQIFGVQVQYLTFFSIFWTRNIFIYIFFAVSILTSIYLARQPNDTSASGQALRDRLHAGTI